MLTEKTKQIAVTATAKKNDFMYNVEYRIENGQLVRFNCNVYQIVKEAIKVPGEQTQTVEREEYLGHMLNESGNNQISLRENVDAAPHLEVFKLILVEAKEHITKE